MASPGTSRLSEPSNGGCTPSSGYLLSSWKEIAAYLKKSVRTVQRWETCLGLPVHRPGEEGVVLAYESELDQWVRHGGALPDGNGHGNGNGHARAAERFHRCSEARRRAALLCAAAGESIQALQSTSIRTRELCASLFTGAALARRRGECSFALPDRAAAPPALHGYPNVTVDGGGRNVEAGVSRSRVA